MAACRERYLKGCATPLTRLNTLRKRELEPEGSLHLSSWCSFLGRDVSGTGQHTVEVLRIGGTFADQNLDPRTAAEFEPRPHRPEIRVLQHR